MLGDHGVVTLMSHGVCGYLGDHGVVTLMSHGVCGYLGDYDVTACSLAHCYVVVQYELGDLCCLPTTCVPSDDDHRVLFYSRHHVTSPQGDGKGLPIVKALGEG